MIQIYTCEINLIYLFIISKHVCIECRKLMIRCFLYCEGSGCKTQVTAGELDIVNRCLFGGKHAKLFSTISIHQIRFNTVVIFKNQFFFL